MTDSGRWDTRPIDTQKATVGSPQLKLDNITVRRGRSTLLDAVSITCEPSTITALRGRNGSGKSTLLGVALGLIQPTSGRVTRAGGASFLQENFSPPGGMTVRMYLGWVARMRGVAREQRQEDIRGLLTELELSSLDAPMRLLSKGNLQRVGVASALLGTPDLVVLDEPFSGMDPPGASLVARAIHRGRSAGSTVLVVHHGDGGHLAADHTLQLTEGRLGIYTPTGLRVSAIGGSELPAGLETLGTAHRLDAHRVVIVVEDRRAGEALRLLISYGWQVESVVTEAAS